jgi:two-component system sensor histidine kinase GlrK
VTALRDIVLELRSETAQSALAVGRLEAALVQLDRHQRVYVATTDPASAARMRAAANRAQSEIAALRGAGHGDLLEAAGVRVAHLTAINSRIESHVEAGLLEEATEDLRTNALPGVERAREAIPALASGIDAETNQRATVAQRSAVAAGTATTAAVLVAAALAAALALAAAGVLTQPLDGLRRAMARVADGTFETPVDLPYERGDELGELSRSFRTMTLRLAELDRHKADFVGTASHDLKTPISIIAGYAELIREDLDGPLHVRQHELLRAITEQTNFLLRRVDQLLEISRTEAGRLRLGLEEINIRHFADEVHRAFEPAAHKREIRLDVSVHDAVPACITADPDVLRADIIDNLISNALRFTPSGGLVRVSFGADGERLSIEVADTGCGIPQDQLDHIFDKYYQGRGSHGGPGLGLAIAKAGVEAHGGRIDVSSRVERGTRFRMTLPQRAMRVVTAPAPAREAIGLV